jgi:LPXTG-site transpeptidase (sortase) family protein
MLMHTFNDWYELIRVRRVPFLVAFFFAVLVTYAVLFTLDFIPEPKDPAEAKTAMNAVAEVAAASSTPAAAEPEKPAPAAVDPDPIRIIFDSLNGKTVKVQNPESRSVAVLDEALLSGAVRHPDSADLSNPGNIFILGHSSYLPVVYNKNFQAFNGIQDLKWGDTIRLQSSDTEYIYRVQRVYKAKAADVVVPQTPGKAQLTLATCNSFGTKDDRFIVEASLVSSNPL